jgi:hypothetical protein
MDIQEISRMAHKQLKFDSLVPVDEKIFYAHIFTPADMLKYEEWKAKLESHGYDMSRFYMTTSTETLNRFFYVGDYVASGYPILHADWLTNDFTKEQTLSLDTNFRELFEAGNYEVCFFPENNSFAIAYFIKHYDNIPKAERFAEFVNLYLFLESGFEAFPEWMIAEILEQARASEGKQLVAENVKAKKGMVKVYRGQTAYSTPLEKTLSWTLSLKVAKGFAKRDAKSGSVYRAEVAVEDVLYFIGDRNEEEVWVQYKDLNKLKKIR